MKSAIISVLVVLFLTLSACSEPELKDPNVAIGDVSGKLTGSATDLHTASDGIKKDTAQVRNAVPAATRPIVEPPLANIDKHADDVAAVGTKLTALSTQLDEAKADVEAYKTKMTALTKERDDAVAAKDNVILKWIASVAVIAIAAGIGCTIAAFYFASQLLGFAAVACYVIAGVAIAFHRYYDIIALGAAGLLAVGLIAGAVWFVRQLLAKNAALSDTTDQLEEHKTAAQELVQAMEIVKAGLTKIGTAGNELRKKLFGDGIVSTGEIYHNNSEATDAIVADIRDSGTIVPAPPLPASNA